MTNHDEHEHEHEGQADEHEQPHPVITGGPFLRVLAIVSRPGGVPVPPQGIPDGSARWFVDGGEESILLCLWGTAQRHRGCWPLVTGTDVVFLHGDECALTREVAGARESGDWEGVGHDENCPILDALDTGVLGQVAHFEHFTREWVR